MISAQRLCSNYMMKLVIRVERAPTQESHLDITGTIVGRMSKHMSCNARSASIEPSTEQKKHCFLQKPIDYSEKYALIWYLCHRAKGSLNWLLHRMTYLDG